MADFLFVFVWVFALGAAVAIPMALRKSRLATAGWLALYLLLYSHLSSNGRYAQDLSTGYNRWMPLHCESSKIRAHHEIPILNGLGAFFGPLVFADRMVVHPRQKLNTPPSTASAQNGFL